MNQQPLRDHTDTLQDVYIHAECGNVLNDCHCPRMQWCYLCQTSHDIMEWSSADHMVHTVPPICPRQGAAA